MGGEDGERGVGRVGRCGEVWVTKTSQIQHGEENWSGGEAVGGWEGQGVGPARGLKAYVPAGWGGRPAGQGRSPAGGRRLASPPLPPHGATNDRADSTFHQEQGTPEEAAGGAL